MQFPRKTVGRSSSEKTDEKRIPILQGWLNLVIGVYAQQPSLAPHITNFLDEQGQSASTARLTISRHQAAFDPDPHLLVGNWLARGMNKFAQDRIEEERFTFKLEPDGFTLTGAATNPEAEGGKYTLQDIKLVESDGVVILQFVQVYDDSTKTGWYSAVDRPHLHLTNGTWMAQSGTHHGQQVGTFTADKILDDPTPGPFRVISQDGVLARAGPEQSDEAITKLDRGEEVEVLEVFRRSDGVMRLCFSKAGLEISVPEGEPIRHTDGTERLWVSERKTDDQSLLLERIEEGEPDDTPTDDGESYTLTVVAEGGLITQEVSLQLSGIHAVEDLTAGVVSGVSELAGATNLQFLYSEPEFDGEFVVLDDLEDLPEGGQVTIQVTGTPAPLPEPEPMTAPAPAPATGARTLKLLVYTVDTVGKAGNKITVKDVTTLEDLVAKLRESDNAGQIPEGTLAVHQTNGQWPIGTVYTSLDEITGTSAKVCIKAAEPAEAGVPPVAALPEREPPTPVKMNVMVKTSDLVQHNKKVGELSATSLDELCDALKVKCDVTAENVAIYLVRSLP